MAEPIAKFWMVWNQNGRGPIYKHPSKALARKEAERLSRMSPGSVFFVLATVDAVIAEITPPETVKLVKPDPAEVSDNEIPF
ncbi:hypothetical protein NL532_24150 [Mesorhizobium sp. C120A]|uniref:hypothetical protein n=1 Tax=unclassified Mesorhizobium TaxID=325217 RepID=UPI0003D04D9E|nr:MULTISPECIES: hypothetical protein [unclassified Mesorhizobium]ESZ60502.1 hypothetical protein X728_15105 [Mesorhizobium sp. L103C120A0]WJI43702.1 hypothetical protein NL532_24150 [Mesorhizobium sp. C120A]